MRKKMLAIGICLALTAGMAACGNEAGQESTDASSEQTGAVSETETGAELPVPAETAPENVALENDLVALSEYKGLEVEEVTAEDIEVNTLSNRKNNFLRAHTQEVTDRPAEEGDMVVIDYSGAVDGVKFDGGTGSADDLVLGSGSMIDGFEDGIIGMEIGETKDVEATFPETYSSSPDLAGKTAVFTITLNAILRTPQDLTDDMVKEYTDYESVEDWEAATKENLAHALMGQTMWDAYIVTCQVKSYPEEEIQEYVERMTSFYEGMASIYSMTLEEFLTQGMGVTKEEFDETAELYAKNDVAKPLIAEAIAEKEGISVSEEEYQEAVPRYMEMTGYYDEEAFFEQYTEDYLRNFLLQEKVQDFMLENARLTAAENS